jgi:hypothetical protein
VSAECGWIVAYAEPVDPVERIDGDDLPDDPLTGEPIS